MSLPKSHSLALILCVPLVFAIGCQTAQRRPMSVMPSPSRTAPQLVAVATPLPLAEEHSSSQTDPVQALLAEVEREYQEGRANYAAGHLEKAKENFDRAFTMLVEAPMDLRSDERLEREFDRIVEGTHELELQALKAGDGFSEQKPEPAPIDEANDVTFPVDPKVKETAEAELKATRSDLPLVMNDYVASYINYYSTSGRSILEKAWTRAGRYREMIERTFKEEGVPQDMLYLAQAESGFHPLALSRAGARGMWQFMASRARGYGLTRNWWVDERQDPEKSTRAAARHLKDLYKQFGDWYLAMAAYNSGPGNVQRAVQRTGFADFWELYKRGVLPRETKNYVPIIVAITIMAKNPAQYGLDNIQPEAPPKVDVARINYPVDLRLVAECIDASVTTLQELNPSLLRMTTPKTGDFDLKLPEGSGEKYHGAIAAIPVNKRVWWRYHKVSAGETLTAIARQYRTTSKAITEVNGLGADEIEPETKLIIPMAAGKYFPGGVGAMHFSTRPTRYKVRRGDTVLSIADDFGVPADKLRKWNRLKGNKLKAGRTLVIYRPVAQPETARTKGKSNQGNNISAGQRLHKVRAGDTLYSIAAEYGTSVAALRRDNRKATDMLHPGDVLVIK
ncbi:MAG: LysM peptidoglycan-binding domain-containing protein [Acidobacteriales bacterium]|nr:LysM peptidoglycan-binding domain-containing protein [Terriglobales bacterium]